MQIGANRCKRKKKRAWPGGFQGHGEQLCMSLDDPLKFRLQCVNFRNPGPHRAPSGPIGPHRLKKSSLCRFLCNDSFVTSLYAGPFARYPTLSRSNCGEGMVKSPSVSSAPQNEHMTKQHKPDVGSEDSQPLNAKSLQCCATTSHSHAKSLQRTK